MPIHIFKNVEAVIERLAHDVIQIGQGAIKRRDEFNFVLAGGRSPEVLYTKLTAKEFRKQFDWNKVNFFFGDERYVPANDPQNNATMVRKALFDPLNIDPSKIFAVDTSLPPDDAAVHYTKQIETHFKGKVPQFDLILLGLGDNAHTASLFPHTEVLNEASASVRSVFVKEQNAYRITMTAPLINQAHHIAFLVYGRTKAEAVQHVLEGEYDPGQYPAQLINAKHHDCEWYLDGEAASLLKVAAPN